MHACRCTKYIQKILVIQLSKSCLILFYSNDCHIHSLFLIIYVLSATLIPLCLHTIIIITENIFRKKTPKLCSHRVSASASALMLRMDIMDSNCFVQTEWYLPWCLKKGPRPSTLMLMFGVDRPLHLELPIGFLATSNSARSDRSKSVHYCSAYCLSNICHLRWLFL